MTSKNAQRVYCDYLIIGSGLAGLTAALQAAEHGKQVMVITKSSAEQCNTR